MDLSLKTSAAKLPWRPHFLHILEDPEPQLQALPPALPAPPTVDEELLRAVERLCSKSIAVKKVEEVIAILRRAYKITQHTEETIKSGQLQVTVPLAKAIVRLRLSAALAAAAQRGEALTQAREAVQHADKAWRQLLVRAGSPAQPDEGLGEEATDSTPPPPSSYVALRGLLVDPPPMLGRAAVLAVETRCALAHHLEVIAASIVHDDEGNVHNLARNLQEEVGGCLGDLTFGDMSSDSEPWPPPAEAEDEAVDLRREAMMLARHFLPGQTLECLGLEKIQQGPDVRVEAKVAGPQGRSRSLPGLAPSSVAQQERSRSLPGLAPSTPPAAAASTEECAAWGDRIAGCMKNGSSARMLGPSQSAPYLHRGHPAPPKGDILAHTMPERRSKPRRRKHAPKAAQVTSPTSASSEPPPYLDPFTDWKQNTVNRDKMSLTTLRVQTFEGQAQVKSHLKQHSRMFKAIELKELDQLHEHRLFENVTRYSGYGVRTVEMTAKRKEIKDRDLNPPSEKEKRRIKEEQDMFEHYGLSFSKGRSTPSMKDVRKLMHECQERSPIVKEQRRHEAEQQRIEEERLIQETLLEKQRVQREKLGGLSLGKGGQTMLVFNP